MQSHELNSVHYPRQRTGLRNTQSLYVRVSVNNEIWMKFYCQVYSTPTHEENLGDNFGHQQ